MTEFSLRRPSVNIDVITREGRRIVFTTGRGNESTEFRQISSGFIAPSSDLKSCQVDNDINSSGGSWSIQLVYRMDDNGQPLYMSAINPMDAIFITLPSNTGETTMIGIVDRVNDNFKMGQKGPDESITISGKGLGSIWEYDLIKYYKNAIGLSKADMDRNLKLMSGAISLKFFGKPAYEAIQTIHAELPTLDGIFADTSIKEYINVSDELWVREGEAVFLKQASPYQGSVWDYFKQFVAAPFSEMWVDYKGGQAYLRMRPTPFSMEGEEEAIVNANGVKDKAGWRQIVSWTDSDNWAGHDIELIDVVQRNLSKDHQDGYSVFCVVPGQRMISDKAEYSTFPPFIDKDNRDELGNRDFNQRIPYIPVSGDNEEVEGTKGTIARFRHYRKLAYLWFKDNHRFQKGGITVKGNADYRPGDKVFLKHRKLYGMSGYITKSSHAYTYGAPFMSTLVLSRVMDEEAREQWYALGKRKYEKYDS
jgi:hypothetical protein